MPVDLSRFRPEIGSCFHGLVNNIPKALDQIQKVQVTFISSRQLSIVFNLPHSIQQRPSKLDGTLYED